MNRIDIAKLRKRAGMSQRELAEQLQVRPSFISAIENGRSRLPEDKIDKLKEIFEIDSIDDYVMEDENVAIVPPHTHADHGDSLTQLLTHIHSLAHMNDHSFHNAEAELRVDYLTKRNDRLTERVDELTEKIEQLMEENLRLKEILIRNGIEY